MNQPVGGKTTALDELPATLREAVERFREDQGRQWKARLASGWLKSAYPGELQQVRNQFGPEWLVRVRERDFGSSNAVDAEHSSAPPLESGEPARVPKVKM